MSVQEQFEAWAGDQEEAPPRHQSPYSSEFRRIRGKQAQALEYLREVGVVGVIEQTTGGVILPITDHHGYLPRPLTWIEERVWGGVEKPKMGDWMEGQWRNEVLLPQLAEDGSLDPALYITTSQIRYDANLIKELTIGSVLFKYGPRQVFEVRGADVTYRGRLPQDEIPRIAVVEQAFARALLNPARTSDVAIFKEPPMIRFT